MTPTLDELKLELDVRRMRGAFFRWFHAYGLRCSRETKTYGIPVLLPELLGCREPF